ncbi:hypothetical protein TREES_T100006241 [Tupaia chinensis]|uniref:Uncharacterized protein n=1 Tax=Tupaia chinensis TaxID=246437 RepID=L9LA21_TUPCH|nr:hypothetical protein TREES_T100006241 [Tupaia chinensis]
MGARCRARRRVLPAGGAARGGLGAARGPRVTFPFRGLGQLSPTAPAGCREGKTFLPSKVSQKLQPMSALQVESLEDFAPTGHEIDSWADRQIEDNLTGIEFPGFPSCCFPLLITVTFTSARVRGHCQVIHKQNSSPPVLHKML